jgi:hypothetical protein
MSVGSLDSRSGPRATSPQPVSRLSSLRASLLHEPLLHFFLIGALIFAINAVVTPSVNKDKLIEVTPEVRASIVELFMNTKQRAPTTEEMDSLIDVWILNEITFREALAQGLDKGDDMIRERIMQKMRVLIFSNLMVNDPTDAELKPWFEAHRARYDTPETLSFFELPVGGADAEAKAQSLLQQIEAGDEPEDIRLRAHVFAKRPRQGLEAAFGKPFVDQLTKLPIGKWQAAQSSVGWHIVRVDAVATGKAIELNAIASQVISDWKDEKQRSMGTEAVRNMGRSYVIRRDHP